MLPGSTTQRIRQNSHVNDRRIEKVSKEKLYKSVGILLFLSELHHITLVGECNSYENNNMKQFMT